MRSLLERIAVVWAVLGGVVLLSIVLVTSTNVAAFGLDRIARLFGDTVSGLPGYEDYVRLAISAAALMFFPYCQARRGHVAVDLFVSLTGPRTRKTLDAISLAGMTALAGFLCYWMVIGMLETRSDGALSRVLGWPEWPFYLPGILSLLLWTAIALDQLFEDLGGRDRRRG
jgi:TRAP-type C4-dicarboxylate transport system permease small subunit